MNTACPEQINTLNENETKILHEEGDIHAPLSEEHDIVKSGEKSITEKSNEPAPDKLSDESWRSTDTSKIITSPVPQSSREYIRDCPPDDRGRAFLEQFRKNSPQDFSVKPSLYDEWTTEFERKNCRVRCYRHTTEAFSENFLEMYENKHLKKMLSEVLWPIAYLDRDENGDFWCLMPAPDEGSFSLDSCIFPKQKKVSGKYAIDLCISFATFLCKFRDPDVRKFLKYFDPEEIFLDLTKGRIYFTGFDQIIDQRFANIASQEIEQRNQRQWRTFLLERFMPPDFLESEHVLPKSEDLNYYIALFSCFLLLWCHPYEGVRWARTGYISSDAAKRLYGADRIFLFDQADPSNGPVQGFHDLSVYLWNMQPQRVQALFENSFSRAVASEGRLPNTFDWLKTLIYLRSVTYFCPCGNSVTNQEKRRDLLCNYCKSKISLPLQISFGYESYRLSSQMLLYYGQFNPECTDFRSAVPVCRIWERKSTGEFGVESLVRGKEESSWTVVVYTERKEVMLNAGDKPFPVHSGDRICVDQCEAKIN